MKDNMYEPGGKGVHGGGWAGAWGGAECSPKESLAFPELWRRGRVPD